MNKRHLLLIGLLVILGFAPLTSCKKTVLFSKGNLSFSKDTVVFDTIFTTIGSTTQQFKFYNNDNKAVIVEDIQLMGGTNSPYRINVDGVSGTNFSDIELPGNDSLFVFVEVTLDPNNGLNPMIIEDSIRFRTNGTDQYVQLAAWGQDAYFHYSYISQGIFDLNEGTWPNDKPHVIYGAAFVDSAKTLNIQAGTDIYLHKGAMLYNYKGVLNIDGTMTNPVTLQGDRLESEYDDVSGQFYGIYMQEALESTIDYAIIRNGTAGIHLFSEDASNTGYTLNLSNTVIENCARYGVFIFSGAKVKAENCIIGRNGTHGLLVLEGGDFNFNYCTIVGYDGGDDQAAAVGITNYYEFLASINEGTITNSVIYGNLEHELAIDTIGDPGVTLNFMFENNLIRSATVFTDAFFQNNIWNQNPQMLNPNGGDYHWLSSSPLNGAANSGFTMTNPETGIPYTDIEMNARDAVTPDIGAYENI